MLSGPSARRVVVTGAAGRLGGGIASVLQQQGRLIGGVDIVPGPLVSHVLDLASCSTEALRAAFDGADAVVHAAAHPGPSASSPACWSAAAAAAATDAIGLEAADPVRVGADNFAGTLRVYEAAGQQRSVRRVVFSSTAFTMGWCHDAAARLPPALPLREEDALPLESYGLSKLAAEHAAATYCAASRAPTAAAAGVRPLTSISLRFTNIVKREQFADLPWMYPGGFDADAAGHRDAAVPAPPFPLVFWAWTHEDDVVDAHVLALEGIDSWSEALAEAEVLGVPGAASLLLAAPSTRFAQPTAELLRQHFGSARTSAVAHKLQGTQSVLDASRARRALGWTPRCWSAGKK
eukprot:g4984.t1